MPETIAFAPVLNLHQPERNLEDLLEHDPWTATEILYALDRIPRALWQHERVGRIHLSVSGSLLSTLADPCFQARAYGIVDCGSLLWHWQNTRIIEALGTGYYHPVLPLVPAADWPGHLERWRALGEHLFARSHFSGFWPPELGFTMELIPLLRRLGYHYAIVDSSHVEARQAMSWEELRYRPHLAHHDGAEMVIVVRDRELSDAQEAGMAAGWFVDEVRVRTQHCDFTPLVVTASDGDNGGWFRNTAANANFWGAFYGPLLERVVEGDASGIRPTFIDEYLASNAPAGEVVVRPGAWNTGWHDGSGFTQWTGSSAQHDALARIEDVSSRLHAAEETAAGDDRARVDEALVHLLRAETSCYLYWGDAWVGRCHDELDRALALCGA